MTRRGAAEIARQNLAELATALGTTEAMGPEHVGAPPPPQPGGSTTLVGSRVVLVRLTEASTDPRWPDRHVAKAYRFAVPAAVEVEPKPMAALVMVRPAALALIAENRPARAAC